MSAFPEAKTFSGTRLVFETGLPFDEVLRRFHAQVGHADMPTLARLAVETPDEQAYAREIEARFVGKSGFMLFSEIDHGGWIARFGIRRQAIRLIFGNPLIAITMIREELLAGLFVPVEMLVVDAPDGGSKLAYVEPSSLIAIDREDSALRTAAEALDAKVAALVTAILDSSGI